MQTREYTHSPHTYIHVLTTTDMHVHASPAATTCDRVWRLAAALALMMMMMTLKLLLLLLR